MIFKFKLKLLLINICNKVYLKLTLLTYFLLRKLDELLENFVQLHVKLKNQSMMISQFLDYSESVLFNYELIKKNR